MNLHVQSSQQNDMYKEFRTTEFHHHSSEGLPVTLFGKTGTADKIRPSSGSVFESWNKWP